MAKTRNKVELLGRMGSDIDVRSMPSGTPVGNFSLATDESYNHKETGERLEKTEWHRLVVFGRLVEIFEKYTKKGSLVFVEGKLQTRRWEDDQGVIRYTTEIVVNDLILLDSKKETSQTDSPKEILQDKEFNNKGQSPESLAPQGVEFKGHNFSDFDDDIPF